MLIIAGLANAQDWQVLQGAEIARSLADQTLDYGSAQQHFFASGRTSYMAGRESWGYWRVEGDAYCSQWPPRDTWVCYKVHKRDPEIRFVGSGGDITTGRYSR